MQGSPSHPDPSRGSVRVHNRRDEIDAVQKRLREALEEGGYPDAARFAVRLALEEALSNAFRHGHKDRPDDPVTVEWEVSDALIRVAVEDQGPGFDPNAVPDPTLEENLESPSGRGLLLMRAYMGDVRFEGQGNRVVMELRADTATPTA